MKKKLLIIFTLIICVLFFLNLRKKHFIIHLMQWLFLKEKIAISMK